MRLFAAPLPLEIVLREFVSRIVGSLRLGTIVILFRDEGEPAYRLRAAARLPRGTDRRAVIPENDALVAPVARTARFLLIENPRRDRRCRSSALGGLGFSGVPGLLVLPITIRGRVNGLLAVGAPRGGPSFTTADAEWFLPIAEQAALGWEKIILAQVLQLESKRRALVSAFAEKLTTTLSPQALVGRSLRAVCRLLRAGGASILLYDEKRDEPGFARAVGPEAALLERPALKPGKGVAGWVFANRKPVLVRDARSDHRFREKRGELHGRPAASFMAVPLLAWGRTIGVLEAVNRPQGGPFTPGDLQFLETLAAVVAVALDSGLLCQGLADNGRRLETKVREKNTSLKNVSRALRETLHEVRELRRFSDEIINGMASDLITLNEEGRVISINPPAREVLRIGQRTRGLRLCDLFGVSFATALLEELRGGRGPIARAEGTITLKTGEQKIVGYSVSGLRLPDGGQGWIMLFRDLTDSKRLENEIRRLDRLVSLGEISANVAHELKNPLTVMYSNMDWLLDKVPEEYRRRVQIVIDHMERMEKIIARMGILSKDQPLDRKAVDFCELITQMLAFLDKTLRENKIEITAVLPTCPLWMEGDPAQLQQALLNIFMNAIQAMGVGGSLAVRLEGRSKGGQPRLMLAVSDTGPGIPPHVLQRIFEPFFTTKETGTGLGLAITSQIVESHGGKISVVNRPEGGATFRLAFPASAPPPAS